MIFKIYYKKCREKEDFTKLQTEDLVALLSSELTAKENVAFLYESETTRSRTIGWFGEELASSRRFERNCDAPGSSSDRLKH